ncbi:cytochrome c [Sediminicoccus sp. KRV36]|uniref:c-type cytochrome n=1 Tax=Sediminicoccus sp. KRV36 TaxID=3133721 RepID=UPI00200DF3D9|nr:cytochrome c [Sediminicoccus rosea]UPY35572.1 cytochrome c [Sediminicoccus rosea]
MLRYLFALGLLASAAGAAAQDQPMAGEGLRLARQWCANCHVVSRGMPPPTGDATPSFPALAAMSSTTEAGLRVFLQTPHANMPDYRLSQRELDAVVAYILSLAR